MQGEIESAAYEFARSVDRGDKVVVGVNRFAVDEGPAGGVFPVDVGQQRAQVERVRELKGRRDELAVKGSLEDLAAAARGSANVLYPMKEALRRLATLGEVADTLRGEFGVYQPS
jgi:methylmalonyl-CoA mutase N-terminal domain/subunit